MDKLKAYSYRIQIISKKENFFNLPNHGYVELIKDQNSYKLIIKTCVLLKTQRYKRQSSDSDSMATN